jgi:fructose-specific phosphotransferase system IIC component
MLGVIRNYALIQLLGLPLVVYGGLLTFFSFAFTAFIGYTNYRGKQLIKFKWHPRMVLVSFAIATIHAILALSLFLR